VLLFLYAGISNLEPTIVPSLIGALTFSTLSELRAVLISFSVAGSKNLVIGVIGDSFSTMLL
jgi:hypothetical protein